MNLQNRIERLEKDTQITIPPGAKLYDADGIQVDATVTTIPSKQAYGEALMADGAVRPVAPFVKFTLEDIIRRAADRHRTNGEKKEATEESDTRAELPVDILFLRVDGRQSVYEIVAKAKKRIKAKAIAIGE